MMLLLWGVTIPAEPPWLFLDVVETRVYAQTNAATLDLSYLLPFFLSFSFVVFSFSSSKKEEDGNLHLSFDVFKERRSILSFLCDPQVCRARDPAAASSCRRTTMNFMCMMQRLRIEKTDVIIKRKRE